MKVGVVRIVRVPGIIGERRLDDREVVLILRVQGPQRVDSVPEDAARLGLNREEIEEVMGDTRRRLSRRQNPQNVRAVPVIGGRVVVRRNTVRVGTRVLNLQREPVAVRM